MRECMQELVARASACIADGDVLTTAVRRHQVTREVAACDGPRLRSAHRLQRWALMPYAVVTGSVHPTAILRCVRAMASFISRRSPRRAFSGRREAFGIFPGERNFNRFPAWLVRGTRVASNLPHVLTCSAAWRRARTRHRASSAGCCQSCRRMRSSVAHAPPTGAHHVAPPSDTS